jgi:hypothetical protein
MVMPTNIQTSSSSQNQQELLHKGVDGKEFLKLPATWSQRMGELDCHFE